MKYTRKRKFKRHTKKRKNVKRKSLVKRKRKTLKGGLGVKTRHNLFLNMINDNLNFQGLHLIGIIDKCDTVDRGGLCLKKPQNRILFYWENMLNDNKDMLLWFDLNHKSIFDKFKQEGRVPENLDPNKVFHKFKTNNIYTVKNGMLGKRATLFTSSSESSTPAEYKNFFKKNYTFHSGIIVDKSVDYYKKKDAHVKTHGNIVQPYTKWTIKGKKIKALEGWRSKITRGFQRVANTYLTDQSLRFYVGETGMDMDSFSSNVNKWYFDGEKLIELLTRIKIIKDQVDATLVSKCMECIEYSEKGEWNWGRSKDLGRDKDKCGDEELKCTPLHERLKKHGIIISREDLNTKLETFITGDYDRINQQFVASGAFNSVFKIDMDNDKHIVVRLTKYRKDINQRNRIMQDEINGLHFQRAVEKCPNICNVYDYGKFDIKGGELPAFLDPLSEQTSLVGVYGILEYNELSLYDYITNNVTSTGFKYSLEYSKKELHGKQYLELQGGTNNTIEFHKKVRFVAELKEQLFSALECIHRNNYLHMDLKSENIMLKNYPNLDDMNTVQIKLIDFGLSCKKNEKRTDLRGTSLYLPPKKWTTDSTKFTTEWDIWATGRILYECLFPALVQESLTNPLDTAANKKILSTDPQLIQEDLAMRTPYKGKFVGAWRPDMSKIELDELTNIDNEYYSLDKYPLIKIQYNILYEIFEKIFDKRQYKDNTKYDRQITLPDKKHKIFTKEHIINHATPEMTNNQPHSKENANNSSEGESNGWVSNGWVSNNENPTPAWAQRQGIISENVYERKKGKSTTIAA